MNTTYKILIVGDSGVGKTAFFDRHVTGKFPKAHVPTTDYSVFDIEFETVKHGIVKFEVWDCPSTNKAFNIYNGVDGAIILFGWDMPDINSVHKWENIIKKSTNLDDSKIVVCRSKCDIVGERRKDIRPIVRRILHKQFKFYEAISSKAVAGIDKPFLQLAKVLTGEKQLKFAYEGLFHVDQLKSLEFDFTNMVSESGWENRW